MIDYQILRERLTALIVETAAALEFIGVTPVQPWRPGLDDVEPFHDKIHDAYKRVDAEWDRLNYVHLEEDR